MKTILKPRGARLSDDHWSYLEDRAALENKKNPDAKTTPSDVIRHAVECLMAGDD